MTVFVEDSDAPATKNTPYLIAAGDVFYGNLTSVETDWVAVTLVAGQTYSFGAVGIGAVGTGVSDPLIKLRGPGGGVLVQNDDGGPGLTASLTYTATSSGTYYVDVRALTAGIDGVYGLSVTEGSLPSYDYEMGAAVLYRGGDSWATAPETAVNLTWAVRASGPAKDAEGHATAFQALSAGQIDATIRALGNYEDVANLTFTQVNPGGTSNSATVLVGAYTSTTDGAGAYAHFPGPVGAGNVAGDLWINNDSVNKSGLAFGTYDYYVFLHELGHAMGLDHPGDYNAAAGVSITYDTNAQFVQDSSQYTVMSYFDATDTEPDAPRNYSDTLMMYDIYALQNLYGANTGTRAGNDVYGFHATVGGAYDFTVNTDPLMCIWDGAGRDTLDLSGFRGKQTIDLGQGQFSDVGGFKGNLSIAVGAEIENAIGGRGGDTIYGNDLNNVLRGGAGRDLLVGGAGRDRMAGNLGVDGFIFYEGCGKDTITDFKKATEYISLSTGLWGGATLTEAEVIDTYAVIRKGHVVLDFGVDELSLLHVANTAGLADHILLY